MIEIHVREKTDPCPACKGSGRRLHPWKVDGAVCEACRGQGYQVQDRWISLDELHGLLAQVGVDKMFPQTFDTTECYRSKDAIGWWCHTSNKAGHWQNCPWREGTCCHCPDENWKGSNQ